MERQTTLVADQLNGRRPSFFCWLVIILIIAYTVNVDIFASINFRGFMKMGNFVCIHVFSTNDSLGYNDSNFHSIYIFADI